MKHTKGPWVAHIDVAEPVIQSIGQAYEPEIATLNEIEGESVYNAHLIAAAPDMLNVLIEVSKLIDRDANGGDRYDSFVYASGIVHNIEKIIAKARGE